MQSQAFYLTARSTGRDLVRMWKIHGHEGPFIRPWEARAITIVGVELLQFPKWTIIPARIRWLMVGNSYTKDIMLMASGKQKRVANWFGKDGFAFPAKGSDAYLDLHGHCWPGMTASVMLNFYYVAI